ncbi:lipopolysaccharide biosynthesis protein [Streptomyces sp. NPDC056817]|uniref:lipopolysaccharide biosynthesis protein n=1 Tax=Streptomyces sp. NPDC056817 TaxID=3345950 RepID=UPI0036B861C9
MSDATTARTDFSDPFVSPTAEPQPTTSRKLRPLERGRGSGGGNQLFRNAYALMLNTGISAVLGLGFWLAAARYYTEDAVGQGSAAIAAMKLLAGLTAVTLMGALARFLPVAGRTASRLIFRTYVASSVVVGLAAGVFLLTLDVWGPSYHFLHGLLSGLGFIAAVVAWSLLTLQDAVLMGLRSALWVPVGNTVFSTVKLGLLVALAVALPATGVFVSWVASIAVSTVPLGWLVLRRLVPQHMKATQGQTQPPTLREIGRFLAGDCTGSLFSLAVVSLVPVIVAAQVSSADNAYCYIALTISSTVNVLAINMGASLTVEGSHDPARLAANTRAALGRMVRIMLPVCGGLFLGAPVILGMFGGGYADAATPLLRWFAVGALLRVVMEIYFAALRAQSRTSGLACLQGLLCVLVLGLTLLLLPRMGLTGAGVAEVSSLSVIVAIATPGLYRIVRASPSATVSAALDGKPADLGTADAATLPREGMTHRGPARALHTSLDSTTLTLRVRPDADHLERRPEVQPRSGTPASRTPSPNGPRRDRDAADHRPTRATSPSLALPGPRNAPHAASPPLDKPGGGEEGTAPPGPGSVRAAEGPSCAKEPPQARQSGKIPQAGSTPKARRTRQVGRAKKGRHAKKGEQVRGAKKGRHAKKGEQARGDAPLDPFPHSAGHARVTAGGTVVAVLLATALGLYWLPALGLHDRDLDRMDGLGLVSVLPEPTLLGAALLTVVFASLLWMDRQHRLLLPAALLATVVSLHALPAVMETEPRFATAWQHLGFLEHIDRTGSALPYLDARWSWPGFFAAAAFVAQACGVTDMTGVIRWWPVVMQLLYLAPMFLLMRSIRAGWRAKWAGAWIFVMGNWVGQDYFSPQGFTYLLYLVFVAMLLVWFQPPRVLGTGLRPGEVEVEPVDRRQRTVLLLVVIGLFGATVSAHQLTPFMMLGVLSALVLLGRCELRGLPILFAVLVAVWVGLVAEPYWSGHFNELFGGFGGVGSNVSSSVSGRINGGSSAHKLVLYARLVLAGGVMAMACWGWWRRRKAEYRERSLPVLAFAPFLGFGMQSYGGEMALRVFMFALPGAALLAGLALFPHTSVTAAERIRDRVRPAPLAALLVGLLLMGGFLVVRWGNESFERVRTGEVAAMDYVYTRDDPTVRLLWMSRDTAHDVTPALPWGARDMEKVHYVPTLAPTDPMLVSHLIKALQDAGPRSYLVINESQAVVLELNAGYSATWKTRLIRTLDQRQELKRVFANDDATVYALRKEPDGKPANADPGPNGPRVTWTPWSVVGALAAVALILLLAVREVVRVAVAPGVRQQRWLQNSFLFSLPLLVALVASLVERFSTLA